MQQSEKPNGRDCFVSRLMMKRPEPRSIAERFAASVTLRQIRYFIAVAETGKVNAAAAMMGISPSVVTEAIASLEALSSAGLFVRRPRGLELTYEGHRFLAHGRNVLSAVEVAGAAIVKPDSDIGGSMTLAATITVMGYFIAPLVARFKRSFPNVAVNIVEAPRTIIESGLLEGRFDLAIMLTSNLSERGKLLSRTLFSSMRRLWLPSQHPFLHRDIVTLDDVAPLPYIQLLTDDAEASTAAYWGKHDRQPNIVVRTDSVEAIRSFIANQQGVTILSDMMYRPWSLEGDRIEVREVEADIPMMTTGVVWPRRRSLSPSAKAFLGFCQMDSELLRSQSHRPLPPPSA
jgi:DNA-binding transcriptional LysR family regulator